MFGATVLTAQESVTKRTSDSKKEFSVRDTVPKPKNVMLKSLILPGWGQITNKQAWKAPIVYAAILGVGYYSYWLNGQYVDYRAAYYNSFAATNEAYADEKYGPTPDYLVGVRSEGLLYYRDYYRNERDKMVVFTILTYGLNVIDAYIFAHLRDFDVSDDLSVQTRSSVINGEITPQIRFTFRF
ncbi:MAG: hypothetical protein GW809_04875 [Bacteroidetes bacterium]|nr:hypothetical protein [Bacteroidota bacterium]